MLMYSYLSFFVIGMVPVVHGASLQGEVPAMPHTIPTDQLKHRLENNKKIEGRVN